MRLLLSCLLLCTLACKRPVTDAAQHRITIATTQEPDGLLPFFSESAGANQVMEGGMRYLTQYNRDWQVVPGLATRVPTLENGGVELLDARGVVTTDGEKAARMRVSWNLDPRATWADGTPVTSMDVVFGHRVLMDPSQEVRDRSLAEKVEEVRAVDDKTVVVTWKEPFAFYHAFRNHAVLPAHQMEAAWRGDGGNSLSLKQSRWMKDPLYFGPFIFAEWKPGQFVRLTRNPHASVKPVLDEVVWQFVSSDRAALSALEAGTVDAIAPDGTATSDMADELQARRPGAFHVDTQPGMVWTHIDFNLEDAWLKDVRVRRALMMALNRDDVIGRIFKGRYTVAQGLFPPRHEGANPAVSPPAFNPVQARAELDALGFKPGADGIRSDATGARLTLELAYATGVKPAEDMLLAFQSQWKDVGVEVVLKGMPAKILLGDVLKHRQARHLAFYAYFMDPMTYAETFLSSRFIPHASNSFQGQNQAGFRNAQVDALVEAIPRTLDATRRRALLQQLNALFVQHLPMMPIYCRPVLSITQARLAGWAPTGTHTTVSWNAETWHFSP